MPLASMDGSDGRLSQLREIFPDAFTEGRVDFERLRQVLGDTLEDGRERYGLAWAGKSEAVRMIQAPSVATLLPDRETSVDFDLAQNVFIEGENLEVLKLLQRSYYGRVKLIYIDPPYNTGKEFLYPDDYRDSLKQYLEATGQVAGDGVKLTTNPETGGRYHSRWLSMMYPRLFLARNLLSDDGVIFVSIDDHEVHNLRLLMDESFGPENFVEQFVWKKSYGGGAKEKFAVTQHEYVVLYARRAESLQDFWLPSNPERGKYYRHKDDKFDLRGPFRLQPLEAAKSMDERENLRYPIPHPHCGEVWPQRQWLWSRERTLKALAKDELVFNPRGKQFTVAYKQYLRSETGAPRPSKPVSVIDGVFTQHGTDELRQLLGGQTPFQFPKPVNLIKKFISLSTRVEAGDIVLDFFSGSGTTGEAVMRLNAEDGGDRRFILVQFPEPTGDKKHPTISDIARNRLKAAVEAIQKKREGELELRPVPEGTFAFKAFRLGTSNFKVWNADEAPRDSKKLAAQLRLYAEHRLSGRSEEDVLYELVLKAGFPLTSRIEKRGFGMGKKKGMAYTVAEGELLVSLDDPISHDTLRAMIAMEPRRVLCLDEAFRGNDQLKTNVALEMRSHEIDFQTV
ncbi:site-specific DNA-methyltransferase [soil metagenome]